MKTYVCLLAQELHTSTPTTVLGTLLASFGIMLAGCIWLIKVYYPSEVEKARKACDDVQKSFLAELKTLRETNAIERQEDRKQARSEQKEERELCREEFRVMTEAIKENQAAIIQQLILSRHRHEQTIDWMSTRDRAIEEAVKRGIKTDTAIIIPEQKQKKEKQA